MLIVFYLSTYIHFDELLQTDSSISIFVVLSYRFVYPFFIYKKLLLYK